MIFKMSDSIQQRTSLPVSSFTHMPHHTAQSFFFYSLLSPNCHIESSSGPEHNLLSFRLTPVKHLEEVKSISPNRTRLQCNQMEQQRIKMELHLFALLCFVFMLIFYCRI